VEEIEELEREYLARTASESQNQGQDITLQDSQVYILNIMGNVICLVN
jgi:hypothetical protein